MRGVFVDANGSLADIFERQNKAGDPAVHVNRNADIKSEDMPALLDGAEIVVIDHTSLPTDVAQALQRPQACGVSGHRRAQLHEPGGTRRARHRQFT